MTTLGFLARALGDAVRAPDPGRAPARAAVAARGRARHGDRALRRRACDASASPACSPSRSRRTSRSRSVTPRASAATTSVSRRCVTCRGPISPASRPRSSSRADGEEVTVLRPQKRLYNSGGNPMTEAGIEVGPARDLFAALGDDLGQGRWSVRLQYKPLIRYIWLGAILIALGGGDRRIRPTLSRARAGARRRAQWLRPRHEAAAAIPGAGTRLRRARRLLRRRPEPRPRARSRRR